MTGYHSLLSASDTSYAVTALLECDTTPSKTKTSSQQDDSQQQRVENKDNNPLSQIRKIVISLVRLNYYKVMMTSKVCILKTTVKFDKLQAPQHRPRHS